MEKSVNSGETKGVVEICDLLVSSMSKHLNGIECYTDMKNAGYSKSGWGEWAGAYAELSIERAIQRHNLSEDVAFYQDRTKNGMDLDLKFPKLNFFGDIKTHSTSSSAILGNDMDTIEKYFQENPEGHIYYLVFNFKFSKDSEHNYEVTHFWNDMLGKSNRNSYGRRMKHDGTLTGAELLDINAETCKNLDTFKQGRNSNGRPRKRKVMIKSRNIDAFCIKKWNFPSCDEE